MTADIVRKFGDPSRWFGLYATDEGSLEFHADILATAPDGSNNQKKKIAKTRRYALKDALQSLVIHADEAQLLLNKLRVAGI